ncbi:MAG TPA: hypothetical protein DDX85_12815 [Nitrospiraceae bacterium]|nr:hypothetical protein [Nitrospiraceae bacterium]
MNTGYNDSGWSFGTGVFGTEPDAASYGYSVTTPISNTKKSMFFRNTFTVCNPAEVTALNLSALFDDGMVVYINGTQVYNQGVSGNPPAFDGSAVGHEATTYEAKSLSSVIGLNALRNILVTGNNVIAVGIYNTQNAGGTVSSDIVWDGELVLSNNWSSSILFTGSSTQAQSVNTSGWTIGVKNIKISGDDVTCLAPLSDANGTFNFITCNATGSLSIIPGRIISGNPVDLTSIITANNATNLTYTVTENGGCPAQTSTSIITKKDTWKYNGNNLGNIGTTWKNTVYDDSGWSTGSGIFGYGESYISTLIGAPGQMSVYFRKTFTICDPSAVTYLKFNATYDDGIVVYINGTQVVAAGVTGNPPAWNGGATNHESSQVYQTFNLNPFISNLVIGTNVIAVGLYNTDNLSSDIVFDGELIISSTANGSPTLFSGNEVQAMSVDAAGWTEGTKGLHVSGNDATCFSPLTDATGTFTFQKLVNYYCDSDGDTYISAAISGSCTGVGCAPSGCQTNAGNDCNDSSGAINPAASETCNNVDDNCNGITDENLTRPTTCGVGICSGNTGIETCSAGVWGNNTCNPYAGEQTEGPPGDPSCSDTLDNDCDRQTDISQEEGCHVDHETYCYNGIDDDADGLTDCQDADCGGGLPVRIAGTLPEYFMSIQAAYSSPASIKLVQTQGAVLEEDLLFYMNYIVTFEAGYDCGYAQINGKTQVRGNMTISDGVVTISNGTLEIK